MAGSAPSQRLTAQRIAVALGGGYAFTWGFIALGVAGLFAAGMEFRDAERLASIIGFLLYPSAFLWTFAARCLRRVWMVLIGGGALLASAASLIQFAVVRLV